MAPTPAPSPAGSGQPAQPEIQLTIVWPPEMPADTRASLRAMVQAIGNAAETRLLAAGVPLPTLDLLVSTAERTSSHGGSGRYDRVRPGHCRITFAAGDLTRAGFDGALITIAHEFGHLVVDLIRGWPGTAEPFVALADSVLDEYLAERTGWALIADVPVTSRDAVLARLRAVRVSAAETAVSANDHEGRLTPNVLVAILYHLAYARGARDAGSIMALPANPRRPMVTAVEQALAAIGAALGPDPVALGLRSVSVAALRAAVAAMAQAAQA